MDLELLWFKEGEREDRTSWTLIYFDVSYMNYFDVQRGREDRTSWTLNYFDVSCMCYFVQRGREGGQNMMDFELN